MAIETPIRLAQTVGITTSSLLAGASLTMSFMMVPRLLESPTPLLLKQWNGMFQAGKVSAPPVAAVSAASFFYLASKLPASADKTKFYSYIAAGVLAVGIIPYTVVFMLPTNQKLLEKVEETKMLSLKDELVEAGLGEETAHKLVDKWGMLNLGRSVLMTIAAVLGTWTALE